MSLLLNLSYVPLPNSEHVYLNGLEQERDVDYSILGTATVYVPGASVSGDLVEARYAHAGVAPTSPPARPADSFDNRESNPDTGSTNSDGGVWTEGDVGHSGTPVWATAIGHCSLVTASTNLAYRLRTAPAGVQVVELTDQRDSATGIGAMLFGGALAASLYSGYALVFNASNVLNLRRYVNGVASADLVTTPSFTSWIGGRAALVVVYDPSTHTTRAYLNGMPIIAYTDSTPPTGGALVGFGGTTISTDRFDDFGLPAWQTAEDFYSSATTAVLAGRVSPGLGTWVDYTAGVSATFSWALGAGGKVFTGFSSSRAAVNPGYRSYRIQAGFGGDGYGVVFRAQDQNNYWHWAWSFGNPSMTLAKFVGGVGTGMLSTVIRKIMTLEITPTQIKLYADGALIVTLVDSTLGSATGVGIYASLPTGGNYGWADFFKYQPIAV